MVIDIQCFGYQLLSHPESLFLENYTFNKFRELLKL